MLKVGPTKYAPTGEVITSRYLDSGVPAINVMDAETSEMLYRATVNLDELPASGCAWFKDWSENEGVVKAFEDAALATRTGRVKATGFVEAIEMKLSPELIAQLAADDAAREESQT